MASATVASQPEHIETIVEERTDDQGRAIKVTRKIIKKLVHNKVSKEVAARRKWKKFGDASNDAPGPSTKTTIIGEDVFLNLAIGRNFDLEEDSDKILLKTASKSIQCRHCKGDHWTSKCPFKDMASATGAPLMEEDVADALPRSVVSLPKGRYVPPSLRQKDGATGDDLGRDDTTIRLTNLPDYCTDRDLRELCGSIGSISRAFLSKDQETGLCKGFAFVTYDIRETAEKAVKLLNGHGYANLILKAEWATRRPSA